jgi:hypothetical protein
MGPDIRKMSPPMQVSFKPGLTVLILISGGIVLASAGCDPLNSGKREFKPMSNISPQQSVNELSEEELSRQWREKGQRYVTAINAYVASGLTDGWNSVGEQPQDSRNQLGAAVIAAVRRANEQGMLDGLRDRFPPAYEPLIGLLKDNEQCLSVVLLLDDGRIVLRVGAPYQPGRVVVIEDTKVVDLPDDVITVGRSPNRRYFAVSTCICWYFCRSAAGRPGSRQRRHTPTPPGSLSRPATSA